MMTPVKRIDAFRTSRLALCGLAVALAAVLLPGGSYAHSRGHERQAHRHHHKHKVVRTVDHRRVEHVIHRSTPRIVYSTSVLSHPVRYGYGPAFTRYERELPRSMYWGRVRIDGRNHFIYAVPVRTPYGVELRAHAYRHGRIRAVGRFTASGPGLFVRVRF